MRNTHTTWPTAIQYLDYPAQMWEVGIKLKIVISVEKDCRFIADRMLFLKKKSVSKLQSPEFFIFRSKKFLNSTAHLSMNDYTISLKTLKKPYTNQLWYYFNKMFRKGKNNMSAQ